MIPTMILAGLIAGALPRPWHWVAFAAAVVAWPALLVVSGAIRPTDLESIAAALVLAAANAGMTFWMARGVAQIARATGADRQAY